MNNWWRPLILPDEIKLEYINIILGILDQRTNLLNYFIILGKIYGIAAKINKYPYTQILKYSLPFEDVVKRKYEIEKLRASQSNIFRQNETLFWITIQFLL